MSVAIFADTNVFVYAFDVADIRKHRMALAWHAALWTEGSGRTSFQVLQEFYSLILRKFPDKTVQAREEVRDLVAWGPIPIDAVIIGAAWRIQDSYRLSFWDALVVAAAKYADCEYLLTEDLQTGQVFDGLRVISPFKTPPDAVLQ